MLWRDALEYRSNRLQKDTCFMHRASSTSGLGFIYIGLGASAHIRQLSFDTHTHAWALPAAHAIGACPSQNSLGLKSLESGGCGGGGACV